MSKASSKSKIDGVEIGELLFNKFAVMPALTVKYALTFGPEGRCGPCNRNQNWSDETLVKLKELMESAEKDIIKDIFEPVEITAEEPLLEDDDVPGL